MTSSRRTFLQQSALAAAAVLAGSPPRAAQAIAPIERPFGPKMKLSLAAYSYRKYLAEENPPSMTIVGFLEECAKMGLGAAEPTAYYFPNPLTREFLIQFKRRAFLLGLDISGTAIGNRFTYPPGPDRDRELQQLKQWVDHAEIMGAPCIRIFAGPVPEGGDKKAAIQYAIETTQLACEYAGSKGVYLALENHGGIVAEPDDMLAILQGVQSDWFGVNLDSGNFNTDDPYASLAKIAPYAVNAQIKIEVTPRGGSSQPADFERIIGILGEAGYRGYVSLEYEGAEEPREAVPRYIAQLAKILENAH